jgi:hypothetical protein
VQVYEWVLNRGPMPSFVFTRNAERRTPNE